jgi:magnesium transporter
MRKKREQTGLPPGSVIFTGNQKVEKILIHYIQYDSETLKQKVLDNHAETIFHQSPENKVDWYDIRGLHDLELIQLLGTAFDIHPLILEDIADVHQRPKFEEYDNGNFISIRALKFDKSTNKISTEQVTLFFKKGFLLSFQETESNLFEAVRQRIQSGKGKIRQRGADYLAYAIMDVIVDNYYLIMEDIEDVIELLEDRIMEDQDANIKGEIHRLKKELLVLRKSISPLREAISRFSKTDSPFVKESSLIFIRDLYDHTIQVMDMVESYRDMLNGLQDLFVTEVSFKMNKVIQLLTLISTIFIPLTFLSGIYGMNFDIMPELHYENGYFVLLGVMTVIFVGLLIYFKKKKWI